MIWRSRIYNKAMEFTDSTFRICERQREALSPINPLVTVPEVRGKIFANAA
jgi:hypothetical protein